MDPAVACAIAFLGTALWLRQSNYELEIISIAMIAAAAYILIKSASRTATQIGNYSGSFFNTISGAIVQHGPALVQVHPNAVNVQPGAVQATVQPNAVAVQPGALQGNILAPVQVGPQCVLI